MRFSDAFSGDREKFSLPDDMPVMHFEYTQFYYPGNTEFPCKPTSESRQGILENAINNDFLAYILLVSTVAYIANPARIVSCKIFLKAYGTFKITIQWFQQTRVFLPNKTFKKGL